MTTFLEVRRKRQQQEQLRIPPLRCGMTTFWRSAGKRRQQEQLQIPPLRCGMTAFSVRDDTSLEERGKKATARATADPSAALRDDKLFCAG
ncbi:hypothetical protein DYQ86_09090 [Acidobacteria bacterium AB60]|nr:hypothetical protein DYQ86_09090 [Acidobacteria bacterium AB60]